MVVEFTNKLFDLKDFTQYSNTFIETGCALGDGVQRALDAGFTLVTSIEAVDKWFNMSYERFKQFFSVRIVKGISIDVLGSVLSAHSYLNSDKPTVIFLDAHPAGPDSYNHEEWIKTKQNFQHETILAELEIILSNSNKHIIIIDDMDGLNPFSRVYIDKIFKANNEYVFRFYDQDLTGKDFFQNKILAAII